MPAPRILHLAVVPTPDKPPPFLETALIWQRETAQESYVLLFHFQRLGHKLTDPTAA